MLARSLTSQAHYLCGSACCESGEYKQAVSHLQKALDAAREKGDSIKDEIWRQLALAKYELWQAESAARTEERARLQTLLREQATGAAGKVRLSPRVFRPTELILLTICFPALWSHVF
jgi:hypothetical protein